MSTPKYTPKYAQEPLGTIYIISFFVYKVAKMALISEYRLQAFKSCLAINYKHNCSAILHWGMLLSAEETDEDFIVM